MVQNLRVLSSSDRYRLCHIDKVTSTGDTKVVSHLDLVLRVEQLSMKLDPSGSHRSAASRFAVKLDGLDSQGVIYDLVEDTLDGGVVGYELGNFDDRRTDTTSLELIGTQSPNPLLPLPAVG